MHEAAEDQDFHGEIPWIDPSAHGAGDEDIEGIEMFSLHSVGIDIGSSTSHLVFSHLTLRREGAALSAKFTVTDRRVLYRSPILLTPYLSGTTIDVEKLTEFFHRAYAEADFRPDQIDTRGKLLFDPAVLAWFWPFAREEPHGHPPFYALVGLVGDFLVPTWAPLPRARFGPMLFCMSDTSLRSNHTMNSTASSTTTNVTAVLMRTISTTPPSIPLLKSGSPIRPSPPARRSRAGWRR